MSQNTLNTELFCFYPATYGGDTDGNALLYNVFDGSNWVGEAQVPATNTSGTPSAIAFEDEIWCFHEGNVNNGQLWFNIFNGTDWLGDTQLNASPLSAGPAACIFLDQVYCFYPATYGSDVDGNALLYNVFDGEDWTGEVQVPATNISQAPSAAVFEGHLYCFHQGNVNNGELWYNVFDGVNWLGDINIPASLLSSGPSACCFQGKLYCFYPASYGQSTSGNALLYNVFDGTSWAGELQVPATNIANNPSAVVLDGMLYCFHEGNLANGQLWYNRFDGTNWLGDTQLQSSDLSWGPGAANTRRIEVRRILEEIKIQASPDLPSLETFTFSIPPGTIVDGISAAPDDDFNWNNRQNPPKGWGMTGVFNFVQCETTLGTLQPGSLIIFPSIRMTQEKADAKGIHYEGKAQFNGISATALYQNRASDQTSLHGQLILKLMPTDYAGGFDAFELNFLGFAFSGNKFQLIPRSNMLNSAWFFRELNGQKIKCERLSPDWGKKLRQACVDFFPGI